MGYSSQTHAQSAKLIESLLCPWRSTGGFLAIVPLNCREMVRYDERWTLQRLYMYTCDDSYLPPAAADVSTAATAKCCCFWWRKSVFNDFHPPNYLYNWWPQSAIICIIWQMCFKGEWYTPRNVSTGQVDRGKLIAPRSCFLADTKKVKIIGYNGKYIFI